MGTVLASARQRTDMSRRTLLTAGAATLGLFLARPAAAALSPVPRRLAIQNLHTGEAAKVDYWADGGYLKDGLGHIAHVLRDHRNNAIHPIDTRLLDLLNRLQAKLETTTPFHVISGYRSPESNAKLAAASGGVAKHSLHMDGMAIDIRVPGVDLRNLQMAAKSLSAGGVGFYGKSNFVHVDVGRVRYW
jgi:uncharacterized protein YcbK (DUF882 family)